MAAAMANQHPATDLADLQNLSLKLRQLWATLVG